MFSTQSIDYSIGAPCRALDCLFDQDAWIVGTCALPHPPPPPHNTPESTPNHPHPHHNNHHHHNHQNNTLQIIAYDSDVNELHCPATYVMGKDPIRSVATLPVHRSGHDSDHDLTVAVATEQGSSVTLYKLVSSLSSSSDSDPPEQDNDDARMMRRRTATTTTTTTAPSSSSNVVVHKEPKTVAQWTPEGGFGASIIQLNVSKTGERNNNNNNSHHPLLLALDNSSHLSVWDIASEREVQSVDLLEMGATVMQWDPHSAQGGTCGVAVGVQTSLHILDWRTDPSIPNGLCAKLPAQSIICDCDYNPNKPHVIAVATQDGIARIWDLRMTTTTGQPPANSRCHHHHHRPLLTMKGGHSHWMTTISYNPFHDQLVLTTGTEGRANIWRVGSVSSAPLLQSRNRRVACHERRPHAMYASQWAASEAWMYVTVAWDGTMSLHHVPSKEKYKILL
jgi:EARP and GARP complex-interacting protein 1